MSSEHYRKQLDLYQRIETLIKDNPPYTKEELESMNLSTASVYQNFSVWFRAMSEQVHETAIEKGWWDTERNNGEAIALIHSELSEALEGLRKNAIDEHLPQFMSVTVELADVVIRIMDLSAARGWDVPGAIVAKHEFNQTRERKHGKEF